MSFQKLMVYQKGFELSMRIFEISKSFPKEETYALIDQIRRSSRSICSNIAEAYRKRRYEKHFISKLTDADSENSETIVWVEFAMACKYITTKQKKELLELCQEIGKLIQYMINNPGKFGVLGLPTATEN